MGPICYSMECANEAGCKPKAAPKSIINQNPTIAYVKRGAITMCTFHVVFCYFIGKQESHPSGQYFKKQPEGVRFC